MIIKKSVDINNKYIIEITYHDNNDIIRFYTLVDKTNDKTICESFNRDSFLLKANKVVKISSTLENIIASY